MNEKLRDTESCAYSSVLKPTRILQGFFFYLLLYLTTWTPFAPNTQ